MATIKPFKATRPSPDKVSHLVSRSYDEYSKEELKYTLKYNPFSFLHIINPGFKFNRNISGTDRFKMVRNRYLEFLENDIYQKDVKESLYLYQIKKKDFKTLGLFCACSVLDYKNDVIKKHEDTIHDREELFANYLDEVGFNAEPVLMTYANNESIDAIIKGILATNTEYNFTTTDKTNHQVWKISDGPTMEKLQKAFEKVDSLYIADGHHRSASSNLLSEKRKSQNSTHSGQEAYNFFMAYLIPESEVRIYEFNRMVKDLNNMQVEEFLIALDTHFRIEKINDGFYKPTQKHHFSMYLDGSFYSLYLRKNNYVFTDALSKLDTQILYKTILEPILGIHDLRNNKRISYGYGKHNVLLMKEKIDAGQFAVGFSMVPITIEEIKAIADAGLVMPPKSTYIEPKLRSGLTIYEF